MKTLLLCLALVAPASGQIFPYAPPAPTVVGSPPALVGAWGSGFADATTAQTGTGGTSPTAISCPAGDAEIVGVMTSATATLTFSDSAANSGWSVYNSTPYKFYGPNYLTIGYNLNLGSANTYVKVTNASANNMWIIAGCYSGLTGHIDFSQVNLGNANDTTPWASGTFTTTHARELVVSITDNPNNTPTASLSATSPMVLGINFVYADVISSGYTIYSSVQTSQTQTGTLATAEDFDVITAGFY